MFSFNDLAHLLIKPSSVVRTHFLRISGTSLLTSHFLLMLLLNWSRATVAKLAIRGGRDPTITKTPKRSHIRMSTGLLRDFKINFE